MHVADAKFRFCIERPARTLHEQACAVAQRSSRDEISRLDKRRTNAKIPPTFRRRWPDPLGQEFRPDLWSQSRRPQFPRREATWQSASTPVCASCRATKTRNSSSALNVRGIRVQRIQRYDHRRHGTQRRTL